MEIFDLIRLGIIFQNLNTCFGCLIIVSVIIFVACIFIMPVCNFSHMDIFKRILKISTLVLGLSILFSAITPDPTSYFIEAKYKLYQTQTLSSEEHDDLLKQVDELIDKRVSNED